MQTLDALRRHIATTEDLQSIVHTMKSLSAVSIRQYEKAAASLADYHRTVDMGLQALLRQNRTFSPGQSATGPTATIVYGSDHGLCGRFNEDIADFARRHIDEFDAEGASGPVAVVGFRAAARLEAFGADIGDSLGLPSSTAGLTETVQALIVKMDDWRENRDIRRIVVFHNRHTEAATAEPQATQLIPFDASHFEELAERGWPSRMLPLYTMDADRLFSALVREYLFVVLHRAGAESMASEHASRLAAMQAAERNIEEHLEDINAEYRRRRQQSITDEILDVVSGFEAMRSESGAGAGNT